MHLATTKLQLIRDKNPLLIADSLEQHKSIKMKTLLNICNLIEGK